MRIPLVLLVLPGLLSAQLISDPQAIPKGPNPPVVFINGYQANCIGTDFAGTFKDADKVLQSAGRVSVFFNNCSTGGVGPLRPSLEAEGVAFGDFLKNLKYTDGSAVTQVDVIVHSMGGLILRSYLAGKKDVTPASFAPPLTVPVRKAIFIGTPHFGTAITSLLALAGAGADAQTNELSLGSQFLFDLNTWNQGSDDLRGIDAISIAGNGGTGRESNVSSFDDGVATLTSASLGFYRQGTTRIVPYCHTEIFLLSLVGYCASGTPVLTDINTSPANPVSQIILSFLADTNTWKSTGVAAEAQASLNTTAGVLLQLRDSTDTVVPITGATVTSQTPTVTLAANNGRVGYAEAVSTAQRPAVSITPLSGAAVNASISLETGTSTGVIVKPGPVILPRGVIPAAGPAPFPYDVAPGAYVSIYGTSLAANTQAATIPYPTQIGDVQVLIENTPAQIVFVSSGQINFVYPNVGPGLTKLTVKNANGQHTINVRVAPATPSIFLLDASATAAARNALTSAVVSISAPLHAGDFLSLYLTGLGATALRDGLEYAATTPVITIGGRPVTVAYAGRSPGYAGLDQINVQIPAGLSGNAVPVSVTSNGRTSNTAFLAIQ
jgi:uncharacterized protein (TIGR03437 family)